MQLVSNDSQKDDTSESEPILHRSHNSQRSEECSSSCEITTVGGDCVVLSDDLEDINVDESSHLVNADHLQCRICLDIGGDNLITPCHCKGTQKYVHRSCLDNWRSTKEGFAFAHCTECRALFILRANVPPDRWWLRLKFQFLVARDHAFIFVIVQLIVAFLGVLVYKFYEEELREMLVMMNILMGSILWLALPQFVRPSVIGVLRLKCEVHAARIIVPISYICSICDHSAPYHILEDCITGQHAVLAIVLVGLLYGFFIAIICGQRINERHYHVLAKQELTKGYVVEDREDNKNIPELDPSHVTELRMLGLY
ncbi:hypothetical protein CRYUN_Cryun34aG0105300 [Craigia yunnanensis]